MFKWKPDYLEAEPYCQRAGACVERERPVVVRLLMLKNEVRHGSRASRLSPPFPLPSP